MSEEKQAQPGILQKVQVWLPMLLAITLIAGMLIGLRLQMAGDDLIETAGQVTTVSEGQGKIEELIRYIEAKYVDDVNREELIQQAIEQVLTSLDPHSNYIPAEELKEINEQLEGNFEGIGVEFMVLEDTITVITPLSGGPAASAGILAGDQIITISDSLVAGKRINSREITGLLRGAGGTIVRVGIRRGQSGKLLHFDIKRDIIPMNSLDAAYMLDEQTGYIRINRFSATTYDEFVQALEKLVEQEKMQDLVLDLRHNPGGYLQQATNILSQLFADKDKLLVYTEGRAVVRTEYRSSGRSFYRVGKIAVLIDEGSASASEIIAGAIQDHDRGVIIGRRSFGKGLVQEQYPLRDGSALRLTVARYYTPSGRSIQKPYEDVESYEEELDDRLENGELSDASKAPILDSTRYFTANGHVVYASGGITPDVIIPLDTLLVNGSIAELRQYIQSFLLRYKEENPRLSKMSPSAFVQSFTVNPEMFQSFLKFARGRGWQGGDLSQTGNGTLLSLKAEIKAGLARLLYGSQVYFEVLNDADPMISNALRLLSQSDPVAAARSEPTARRN